MSTRATYRIAKNDFGYQEHYIYGHYDGYESYAAIRFKKAVEYFQKNPRGSLAEALLNIDNTLELTRSHHYHGDTQYRYDISHNHKATPNNEVGVHLEVWKKMWEPYSWVKIFEGKIGDFIKKHLPAEEQQP